MGLNDEDRKTMVGLEMEKADRFLKQAGMMCVGLHFIKSGIIEDRLGAFLTRMKQLREKGDYNCLFEVTKDELLTYVDPAHELINKIRKLLYPD